MPFLLSHIHFVSHFSPKVTAWEKAEHYLSHPVNYFHITSLMSFRSQCGCWTLSEALIPPVSRGKIDDARHSWHFLTREGNYMQITWHITSVLTFTMQSTFLQSKCSGLQICHTADWSMCFLFFFFFFPSKLHFWVKCLLGVNIIGSMIWLIMHLEKDLSVSGNPFTQTVYVNLSSANGEMLVITH